MDETAHGPGWWMAADGQWYPPDMDPDAVARLRAKAGSAPGTGLTPTNWRTGIPAPRSGPAAAAGAPPLAPRRAASGPSPTPAGSGLAGFDHNPFAIRPRRNEPPVTRRRGRLALSLVITLVLVVVLAAGTAVYLVLHPSPHRSAGAVVADFVQQLAKGDYRTAANDVVPAQLRTLGPLSQLPAVRNLAAAYHGDQISAGSVRAGHPDSIVTVKWCDNFNCGSGSTLPAVHQAGGWYVDVAALLGTSGQ